MAALLTSAMIIVICMCIIICEFSEVNENHKQYYVTDSGEIIFQ